MTRSAATRLFLCHDYPPDLRAPRAEVSLAEQRRDNMHLRDGVSQAQFVPIAHRARQDARVAATHPAGDQLSIRVGRKPLAEDNGIACLKLGLDMM